MASIGAVSALSLGAVACSSDEESAATTNATGVTEPTFDTVADTVSTQDAPTIETAAGAPDQTSVTVVAETASPTVSPDPTAASTGSSGSIDDDTDDDVDTDDVDDGGATSDDLDDYIDSLASTTDNFDDLTSTPEDTRCAATAILTPIGVETLQREGISVEGVNDDLDLTEMVTAEAAVGIAEGLAGCGRAIPFAASLAEGEATEDLDDAQEVELFDCISAALDESTALETLTGFLSPADAADPTVAPSRYTSGVFLSGLVEDCGFEATFYP